MDRSRNQSTQSKQRADIAMPLMVLFLAAVVLCVWLYAGNAGEYSSEEAQRAIFYSLTEYGSAVLEYVDDGYNGTAIEIRESIEGHYVYRIKDNFLKGSKVKHVLIDALPNYVEDNAFSCVEGVILYADDSRVAMEPWAEGLEIRSEAEFQKLVSEMGSSNIQANLKKLFNNFTFVAILAGVLLAGFWLLGRLRQATGRENPFSILKEGQFFGQLYKSAAVLAFVLGLVILYCDNIYIDPELFGTVNDYASTIGIPVAAVMLGIVVLRDLFRGDILWFPARVFVRCVIVGLLAVLGMGIGALLAAVANEIWLVSYAVLLVGISVVFLTLAMLIYPIIKLLGVDQFMKAWERASNSGSAGDASGGSGDSASNSDWGQTTTVRDSSGNLHTARSYSQGKYVGDDYIVSEDGGSMTGESGKVYRKQN